MVERSAADDPASRLGRVLSDLAERLRSEAALRGSVESIGRALAEAACGLVDADDAVIAMVVPGTLDALSVVGSATGLVEFDVSIERILESSVGCRVLALSEPIETTDLPNLRPALGDLHIGGGVRTGRIVPLVLAEALPDGRLVPGVVAVFRREAQPFTVAERELIDGFASLAASELCRAQLQAEAAASARQLGLGVATAIDLADLGPRGLMEGLVRRAADAVGADRVTSFRCEGGMATVTAVFDRDGAETASLRGREASMEDPRFTSGGPVHDCPLRLADSRGTPRHTVAMPVLLGGQPVALLEAQRRTEHSFTDADVETLSILVEVAAASLRTAESYAAAMTAQERAIEALSAVCDHVDSEAGLADVFGRLTATVAELVGAEQAAFFALDSEGTLRLQDRAFGIPDAALAGLRELPRGRTGRSFADSVVHDGTVVAVDLTGDHPALEDIRTQFEGLAARDLVAVPWTAGHHELGMLVVLNSAGPGFSDEDSWVLQIAALGAGLVWQQKAMEARIREMSASEETRLRAVADRARQLENVKAEFLRLASHELRSPLAVARGYMSMVENGDFGSLPAPVAEVLPIVARKLGEINLLVDQMLETARLEDERLSLRLETLDLRDALTEAVATMRPLAKGGARLRVDVGAEAMMVEADPARLITILTNLIENAIKYSPQGGEVRCGVRREGGVANVSVSDDGLGIAADHTPQLFKRFGRVLTPENSHINGSGLGLYLAQGLAGLHGGTITVSSEVGVGSTFTLHLPLLA